MRTVGVLMNTLEGSDSRYAGGHVHTFEVLRRLTNYRIIVFGPAYAASLVRDVLPNSTFVGLPSLPEDAPKSAFLFLHRAVTSVRHLSALRACDVVYATSPSLPDIVPASLAKPGRVVVCLFHLLPLPWRRSGSFARNLLAFVAEAMGLWLSAMSSRSVIVGTARLGRQLRGRGFRQRLFVTTNGVEHASRRAVRSPEPRAVFVGRLHPTKGLADLVDAWARVVAEIPAARLTVIGDGTPAYRDALVTRARSLHVEGSIDFVGRVDDATRSRLLEAARLFVFPSFEEGWGIAIAEAMAAGLPVVAYDLPTYEEIFTAGIVVVPLGDSRALARRVVTLLLDDRSRTSLADEAMTLSRTFSWERAAVIERAALDHAAEGGER